MKSIHATIDTSMYRLEEAILKFANALRISEQNISFKSSTISFDDGINEFYIESIKPECSNDDISNRFIMGLLFDLSFGEEITYILYKHLRDVNAAFTLEDCASDQDGECLLGKDRNITHYTPSNQKPLAVYHK